MNIDIKDLTMLYANGHRALNKVNLEIGDGMFGLWDLMVPENLL